jgi:circadian clock protein KaiC
LTGSQFDIEDSEVGVSSLMDAWILVKNIESNGERNRGLYILKARGIAHSNQVREFLLTDTGIELIDTYVGSEGVLMGSARAAQSAREVAAIVDRERARQSKQRELQRKQELYEAQMVALRGQFESERDALLWELEEDQKRESTVATQRIEMARLRHADVNVESQENGARKSRKGTAGR